MKGIDARARLCILSLVLAIVAGCAPQQRTKVLIQMIDAQEKFFTSEIIPPFEKESGVAVDVVHMNSIDSIEQELAKYPGQVSLVKVPFVKGWELAGKDLFKSLDSFLSESEMEQFRSTYMLTSLGSQGGSTYFIPRKFETRLMVYSKSKVADAVSRWHGYRDSVDMALRKYNGQGLPATYALEDDPNQWDFFDVFFVGYLWAHTNYDGRFSGRIAHRGKRYSGTALRIVDRVFECGGDSTAVLTMRGDAVVDAFAWEAAYASSGVYNPKMWEQEWSGTGVWGGFKSGDVFLSFMTQLDCFFIHGTGRDGLDGFLANPDDMGVASMPAGCSLELDNKGDVLRRGGKSITTGGWWWGIPASAPDPVLSYRLAQRITSTDNQIQGCTRFGMIPVRKDILSDMSMMFGGGWITEVYQTSFQQLMHNQNSVVPTNPAFGKISDLYLDAWFDIVVGKNWPAGAVEPRPAAIRSTLESKYAPQALNLLGRN